MTTTSTACYTELASPRRHSLTRRWATAMLLMGVGCWLTAPRSALASTFPAGSLLITDSGNYALYSVPQGGGSSSKLSSYTFPTVQVYPYYFGLAFDSAGDLFMSSQQLGAPIDPGNFRDIVSEISHSGTQSVFANLGEYGQNPLGLAFNSSGNLLAVSPAQGSIYAFPPNYVAAPLTNSNPTLPSPLISSIPNTPQSIAVDAAGDIVVSDPNGNIYEYPSTGGATPTKTFAALSTGIGQLSGGMAFNAAGELLVADYSNNRIAEILPDGTTNTLATIGGINSVTLDAEGNIFADDWNDSNIYELAALGGGSYAASPTVYATLPSGFQPGDLAFAPVVTPEPSSISLAAMGALGAAAAVRKRRRSAVK